MNAPSAPFVRLLALAAFAPALTLTAPLPAVAGQGACARETAVQACQDFGHFTVSATRVQVTRIAGRDKRKPAAQGVRTHLRVRNNGTEPLVLAHRLGTARLVDNRSQIHGYEPHKPQRVSGIGLLHQGQADTQFQLAPGQAREFWLEAFMRYDPRTVQPGDEFTQDFTLAEMRRSDGPALGLVADHTVSLTGLRDGSLAGRALVQQLLDKR